MYLSKLNIEKKHLFLNLELYLSRVDGDFSDEEKMIINTHCIEMHIDNNNFETDMPLDDVITKINKVLTKQENKIFFLELAGTVMADNIYHGKEKELLYKIAGVLNMTCDEIDMAISIIKP